MAAKLSGGGKRKFNLGQNADINVTPFVDVMLVLLIIFMVTAPLATVSIKIDIPPAQAPTKPTKPPTYISIANNGQLFVSFATGPTSTEMHPTTLDTMAGSVAQSLLRAVCGQLVDWKTGRTLERAVIRSVSPPGPDGLSAAPSCAQLAGTAPFELRRLGLHERRAATLVRVCRALELERLHDVATAAVVARISRERGLGPWSAGVVCLEGLGRREHGFVGDLGLVKLLRALRGRPVEGWETAELLAPYGEWAGLASVYLLRGFSRGLIPLAAPRAA